MGISYVSINIHFRADDDSPQVCMHALRNLSNSTAELKLFYYLQKQQRSQCYLPMHNLKFCPSRTGIPDTQLFDYMNKDVTVNNTS